MSFTIKISQTFPGNLYLAMYFSLRAWIKYDKPKHWSQVKTKATALQNDS